MNTIIKQFVKYIISPDFRNIIHELNRIKEIPRYTLCDTNILGIKLNIVDSASFLYMYDEIFTNDIYRFYSKKDNPIIIDGGANIGLSVIRFKQMYPNCIITAFEPDHKIYEILKDNISTFELEDVTLINKALWFEETTLEFMIEGADGGRMVAVNESFTKQTVKTIRLRNYLQQPVELLKLDIEGAETEVIQDVKDLLPNVTNIFVEYHSFADKQQTLSDILMIMRDAGFRIQINSIGVCRQPFIKRNLNLGMDFQLNIFGYRQ